MNNPSEPTSHKDTWARPVDRLNVPNLQAGAVNLNVEGRKITGPVQGFGQMWQKTYTIRLAGSPVSPQALIQSWKENFASFWPQGNHFYGLSAAIAPGQVAILNLAGPGGGNPAGGPMISTGIIVIYADEESFSFMTPQGHMFAGMITFSASHQRRVLIDPRIQWNEAKNIWQNAAIRTTFYTLGAPLRWLRGLFVIK